MLQLGVYLILSQFANCSFCNCVMRGKKTFELKKKPEHPWHLTDLRGDATHQFRKA